MTVDMRAADVVAEVSNGAPRLTTLLGIPLVAVGLYLVAQEPCIQERIREVDCGKFAAAGLRFLAHQFE